MGSDEPTASICVSFVLEAARGRGDDRFGAVADRTRKTSSPTAQQINTHDEKMRVLLLANLKKWPYVTLKEKSPRLSSWELDFQVKSKHLML